MPRGRHRVRQGMNKTVKGAVIVAGLAWACSAAAGDFRGFDWGVPLAEVREREAALPVFATDALLEYQTELGGRPVALLYRFADGRLDGASYHFQPFELCGGNAQPAARRHACERRQVSHAFRALVRELSARYGAPAKDALNALCFRDAARIERYVASRADFERSAMCVWQAAGTTVTLNASHALDAGDERWAPYAELQLVYSGAPALLATDPGTAPERPGS